MADKKNTEFDPDAYLQEKAEEFNPDAYLVNSLGVTKEPMSELKSALHGAAAGATLGFSDELAGATEALANAAGYENIGLDIANTQKRPGGKIPLTKKDLLDAYMIARDKARQVQKEAQETNPTSYLGGSVAGGLALTPLFGPASTGKTLGQMAFHGAKVGALAGGVAGAGTSEAENVSDLLKDVGMGATIGGGLGGTSEVVLPQIGKGVAALGQVGKTGTEYLLGPVFEAFEVASKKPVLSTEGRKAIQKEMTETGQELAKDIKQSLTDKALKRQNIVKASEDLGTKIDTGKIISNIEDELKSIPALGKQNKTDIKNLQDLLTDYRTLHQEQNLTPTQAQQLRKTLSNLSSLGENSLQTTEGKQIVNKASKELKNAISEKIGPEYQKVQSELSNIQSALNDLGITDTHNLNPQQLMSKFVTSIEGQSGTSGGAAKARQVADNFLTALHKGDEELALKYGSKLQEYAKTQDVIKQLSKRGEVMQTLRTGATAGAAALGSAKRGSKELVDSLMNSTELTSQLGQKLTQSVDTGHQQLGQILNKISVEKNPRTRQALVFGLMQQPKYRETLHNELVEETPSTTDNE